MLHYIGPLVEGEKMGIFLLFFTLFNLINLPRIYIFSPRDVGDSHVHDVLLHATQRGCNEKIKG